MKKLVLTLQDVFAIPTATIFNPDVYEPVSAVSIDTRKIKQNSLFIAIKGNNFDGHNFINEAIKKGAAAIMIAEQNKNKFMNIDLPVIAVQDTTIALGDVARIWRSKLKAKIISLTGSAGKTTTKELLDVMLSQKYNTVKTEANNNNHIGVPLTLLNASDKDEVVILEHGTNHFGEIPYTASIANPDYAMITNIGHSHIEFFRNKNGVLKEKSALLKTTYKRGGKIFINTDDPLLKKLASSYLKKKTFGFENKPDVKGNILGFNNTGCAITELKYKNKSFIYEIPVAGEQGAKNFLSAAAVALELGITPKQIAAALKKFKNIDKRLSIKRLNSLVLIDDTYNANPESMNHSIELLSLMDKQKNKIAVLGDMFELGNEGAALHKKIADTIIKNKIGCVYTIGTLMKNISDKLKNKKITHKHFSNRTKLNEFLNKTDLTNSVILIKGSRGMKMEDFVKVIEERYSK